MLNSCRKFVWMKICYWEFEGNLNTHVPLWAQQHTVDRHYSLNLKPWSARTLYMYVYAHADLAQKYSVGLQGILVSRLCSQEENSFFLPWGSQYGAQTKLSIPLYSLREFVGQSVRNHKPWYFFKNSMPSRLWCTCFAHAPERHTVELCLVFLPVQNIYNVYVLTSCFFSVRNIVTIIWILWKYFKK